MKKLTLTLLIALAFIPSFTHAALTPVSWIRDTVTGKGYYSVLTDMLGIGTTTPLAQLDIWGVSGGLMPFRISSSTGASLFEVETNGNVGIGSTTPLSKLSIGLLTTDTKAFTIASSTGVELFTFLSNGRFGIGTTTPTARLSIVGGTSTVPATRALDIIHGVGGTGSTTGQGGGVTFLTGVGGAVGTGAAGDAGDYRFTGGVGGAGNSAGGRGGSFVFQGGRGGTGSTGGIGGGFFVTGGDLGTGSSGTTTGVVSLVGGSAASISSAAGGPVILLGGVPGTSGTAGPVTILGGPGQSMSGANGGTVTLTGGASGGSGGSAGGVVLNGGYSGNGSSNSNAGGVVTINGGLGSTQPSTGGAVNVIGGTGGSGGSGTGAIGGALILTGGIGGSGATPGRGGNVFLYGGFSTTTASSGHVILGSNSNATPIFIGNVGIGSTTPTSAYLSITGRGGLLPIMDVSSSSNTSFFRILANGNVGIGTTSPRTKLEVWGDLRVGTTTGSVSSPSLLYADTPNQKVTLGTVDASNGFTTGVNNTRLEVGGDISFGRLASGANRYIWVGESTTDNNGGNLSIIAGEGGFPDSGGGIGGNLYLVGGQNGGGGSAFDGNVILGMGSSTMPVVGKVGVGTSTPIKTLSVTGEIYATATTTSPCFTNTLGGTCITSGAGTVITGTAGQIPYYAGSGTTLSPTSSIFILPNGNFGIATTSPSERLDVNGNINIPTTSATVGMLKQNGTRLIHTYGTGNTFLGKGAGNTTLNTSFNAQNIGIGEGALSGLAGTSGSEGSYNFGLGYLAGAGITTGFSNFLAGNLAGYNLTSHIGNVMIGDANSFGATGNNTVSIGRGASRGSLAFDNSVFLGWNAGGTVDGGQQTATGLSNVVAIGTNSYVGASNSMVLGGTGSNALKVGIGTSTPTQALDVWGNTLLTGTSTTGFTFDVNATNTDNLFGSRISNFNPASGVGAGLQLSTNGGSGSLFYKNSGTSGIYQASRLYLTNDTGENGIGFVNSGAENMTITDSGFVGIGDTTPPSKLTVTSGDVYIDTVGSGVIQKSPDGACWRMNISNLGVMTPASITCP